MELGMGMGHMYMIVVFTYEAEFIFKESYKIIFY